MNNEVRLHLIKKILAKAHQKDKNIPLEIEKIQYKHCKTIAVLLGGTTHENTVAHLFGISTYKLTQTLKPELETRIAEFLNYKNFESLEKSIMTEIVLEDFLEFIKTKNK
jgi:hypothetical protein